MGLMTLYGQTYDMKQAEGLAATGTVAMVAADADRKIRVFAMHLYATVANANTMYVANGDNALYGDANNKIPMAIDADADNVPVVDLDFNPAGWFTTDTANEALNIVLTSAYDIGYLVTYAYV